MDPASSDLRYLARPSDDFLTPCGAGDPPPAGVKLVRIGRRQVLVARPNPRQYGHLAVETLSALAYARLLDVSVGFLRPRAVLNEALFEVEVDGVRVLRSRTARALLRAGSTLAERADAVVAWWFRAADEVARAAVEELRRYSERHPHMSRGVRARVRTGLRKLKTRGWGKKSQRQLEVVESLPYWRRRLVATPLATHLSPQTRRRAEEIAAELGIGPDTRLVTVHARERGYKLGREMDVKLAERDDSVRNARIETHFAAMDFLVGQGYLVVRIGDPTMTPVARPGVLDLATSPARDPALELYCLFRSRFLLCGESGPLSVSYLTNTPLLTVNATDPISAFPVRPDGLYLLKAVVDRRTDRVLSLTDLLSEEYIANSRDPAKYLYVQNTGEEILEAVREMLDLLDGAPQSPGQMRYRELVTLAAARFHHLKYVRKWGLDRGFLGDGRVARSLAEPWFATGGGQVEALARASAGNSI